MSGGSFWSGFTSIATGAIKTAKEQFIDITNEEQDLEPSDQVGKLHEEIQHLEQVAQQYQKELVQREKIIQQLEQAQAELDSKLKDVSNKSSRSNYAQTEKSNDIINFRIVIGEEESAILVEKLERVYNEKGIIQEQLLMTEEDKRGLVGKFEEIMKIRVQERELLEKEKAEIVRKHEEGKEKLQQIKGEYQAYYQQSQQEIQEKGEQLAEVNQEIEMLKKQVEKIQQEASDQQVEAEQTINSLNVQIESQLRHISELQGNIDTNKQKFSQAFKQIQQVIGHTHKIFKDTHTNLALSFEFPQDQQIELKHVPGLLDNLHQEIKNKLLDFSSNLSKTSQKFFQTPFRITSDIQAISQQFNELMKASSEEVATYHERSNANETVLQKTMKELQDIKKNLNEKEQGIYRKLLNSRNQELGDIQGSMEESYKEISRMKKEIAGYKLTVKQYEHQLSLYKAEAQEYKAAFENYDAQSDAFNQERDSLNEDIRALKQQLKQANASIAKLQKQIEDKSVQISELNSDKQRMQTIHDELIKQVREIDEARHQVSKYKSAVQDLQDLLKSVESNNQALTNQLDSLYTQLEESKEKSSHYKQKTLFYKTEYTTLTNQLEKARYQYTSELQSLQSQINESQNIKREAEELYAKAQSYITSNENLIDRRIVTTFIVNFLSSSSTERVKKQMLESLAGILGFTNEQRTTIGLGPEEGLLADFTSYIIKGDV